MDEYPRFLLRYRRNEGPWQEHHFSGSSILMGRAADSDLQLDDLDVSRQHARLSATADGLRLIDLGSTNGTQVDGHPVAPRKPAEIQPGRLFTIGPFTLVVDPLPPAGPAGGPAGAAPAPRPADHTMRGGELAAPTLEVRPLAIGGSEQVTLGSAPDNQMVLDHPLVSRYHALIERMGSRFRVQDLHSTNGVFVNGRRIERESWLKEGDEVRIGSYLLVLAQQGLLMQPDTGLDLEGIGLRQQVGRRVNLLQDISLRIHPQEFVAIVGMSGAGKTTLLHTLSGYKPATAGQVRINGRDLYQHYDLFRNDIGYVPQRDIVHMELTPAQALDYAAQLRMPPDTRPAERRKRVQEVLADLGLLERKDLPISRLSGGQLKRVSIGIELLTAPRLFFLDEPSSGLDPGTEYEMMKLLRRLADQGRTVLLVTHATKNVMLCDKVVFLARGGYLAFFGPPEDALAFFDQHRTAKERREKEMEFDDIYRILSDPARGSPAAWHTRFSESAYYDPPPPGRPVSVAVGGTEPAAAPAPAPAKRPRTSGLRQLAILSRRNIKILLQDRLSLGLMLVIAPVLGGLNIVYGSTLFDPVRGDATKTMTVWFLLTIVTLLVGALGGVREIVKEVDIYRRERAVNLQILPYVISKAWVGVALAFYQSAVLMLALLLLVQPPMPGPTAYVSLYITLFLSTVAGYLLGLVVSALTPNQNAALLLIVAALVPQFIFSGALLALNRVPGGLIISAVMPSRWVFESLTNLTEIGAPIAADACWALPKEERQKMTAAQKESCRCMGPNVFANCRNFPGIRSPDILTEEAQAALAAPQAAEPAQPTPIPAPTPPPPPPPRNTPAPLPPPAPPPTPADPRALGDYPATVQRQSAQYQAAVIGQLTAYFQAAQGDLREYLALRQKQGDEYAAARQQQGEAYAGALRAYGETRARREKAIGSAEALLAVIDDNFGLGFRGGLAERWLALSAIMVALLALVLVFQKRKDTV